MNLPGTDCSDFRGRFGYNFVVGNFPNPRSRPRDEGDIAVYLAAYSIEGTPSASASRRTSSSRQRPCFGDDRQGRDLRHEVEVSSEISLTLRHQQPTDHANAVFGIAFHRGLSDSSGFWVTEE